MSSKARVMWKIASTERICERKALPSPAPVDAPRTRPAMSVTVSTAGTSLLGLNVLHRNLKRCRRGVGGELAGSWLGVSGELAVSKQGQREETGG